MRTSLRFAARASLLAWAAFVSPVQAARLSPGLSAGLLLPLSSGVSDAYGAAPLLTATLAYPVSRRFGVELGVGATRLSSDLSGPSFVDDAEGTLTLLPLRLVCTWTPPARRSRPWLALGAAAVWSREEVSYRVLDLDESLEASRFDPGATLGGGWEWGGGGRSRIRLGALATLALGDREILRAEGDPAETDGAGGTSHLSLSAEVRF